MNRARIHTTIDPALKQELQRGIKQRRWANMSHAVECCIRHALKFYKNKE